MSLDLEIFWIFFKIGFLSFGGVFGVLPELERMVVLQKHWIGHEQFIQSYVIGQFSPGPNMAMCPLIGYWVNGWPGFLAGFLGIYIPPLIVITIAFALYRKYRDLKWVRRSEHALRPLVLGLILSSALRLWWIQAAGGEAVSSSSALLHRTLALGMSGAGIYLYARNVLGPMQIIFSMGAIWWIVNWLSL